MKLITNARIITMDDEHRTYDDGSIAVDGSRIADIGERRILAERYINAEVIDAGGDLLIPGLINAHTHIFQILYKGFGDDTSLTDWLKKCVYPMSLELTGKDCYDAAMLSGVEMIKGGTTTFVDSHYMNKDRECQDYISSAVEKIGIRAVLGRGTIDSAPAPKELREPITVARNECERIIKTYNGAADGRLSVRVEPLNEKLASESMIRTMSDVARQFKVGMNMHIAETKSRVDECLEKFGLTSIEYANKLGILGPHLLLAHCCWLSEHDIDLLCETDTRVAHNPVSNQYLADGVAPIPTLLKRDVKVTMGPDGSCSNNNQNMFDVMKSAALLHKVYNLNPEILTADQVFEMVTIGAAKALNMDKNIGSLEIGKYADIAFINTMRPCMIPCFRNISNIVYSATPDVVDSVMIHGNMVMKDRELLTIDEEEALARANKTALNLAERSHLMA